ncbi:MAG: hypothetical protein J5912_01645, partial [Clostridia bacterium]|nr:hypothetical protein [Clostridia bacterium]
LLALVKAGNSSENASENSTVEVAEDAHAEVAEDATESSPEAEPAEKFLSPDAELLARQIYGIALLAHKPLDSDAMSSFIDDCSKILERAF